MTDVLIETLDAFRGKHRARSDTAAMFKLAQACWAGRVSWQEATDAVCDAMEEVGYERGMARSIWESVIWDEFDGSPEQQVLPEAFMLERAQEKRRALEAELRPAMMKEVEALAEAKRGTRYRTLCRVLTLLSANAKKLGWSQDRVESVTFTAWARCHKPMTLTDKTEFRRAARRILRGTAGAGTGVGYVGAGAGAELAPPRPSKSSGVLGPGGQRGGGAGAAGSLREHGSRDNYSLAALARSYCETPCQGKLLQRRNGEAFSIGCAEPSNAPLASRAAAKFCTRTPKRSGGWRRREGNGY